MTANPTAEAEASPDDEPEVHADDVAHPLSAYVHGVLTIHFDGGAAVTREASQLDARGFLAKQKEAESSDAVTWETRSWFHWASSRVVFSSFDADRDQTWAIRAGDRRRLAKTGHDRGVVASLVEFWASRDERREPLYSIRAMVLLHQTALSGVERGTWEAVARAYEGERGAAFLARTYRDARGRVSIPVDVNDEDVVDDEAQPDEADGDPGAVRSDDSPTDSDEVAPTVGDLDVAEPLDQPRDADPSPDDDVDGRNPE
ncbi:hypothetical protein KM427_23115 [Nocardioides sp. LMS-CY]|uniref:hypothetical protein n=1 Tax=Nocardioides sp. (strain LMS-CY) TaxID=2840457 RepID=UPI001BFFDE0A|nr:hypothetical protein [Nocardioides sp. LMS-CY]QWF21780.1 hypothetical protein KM427_23115 [Nocardioides sp. LMS-CY]